VLRAIDKLDKFGVEGVKLLLGPGRWDGGKEGEGDFTPGAGLDEETWSSSVISGFKEIATIRGCRGA
jgi:histidyl-tRNA synthetase